MRGEWLSGSINGPTTPQGLTRSEKYKTYNYNAAMASRAMRLKLSGQNWEVSERRQVGDAESMVNDPNSGAWWRNVGMEEGM